MCVDKRPSAACGTCRESAGAIDCGGVEVVLDTLTEGRGRIGEGNAKCAGDEARGIGGEAGLRRFASLALAGKKNLFSGRLYLRLARFKL